MEPGSGTTEFKIAKWLGIVGMMLQPMAAALATAWPDDKIVACVVSIVGAIVAIAGALGYQIPRVSLKKEAMRADAAKAIAQVTEEQKKSSPTT